MVGAQKKIAKEVQNGEDDATVGNRALPISGDRLFCCIFLIYSADL